MHGITMFEEVAIYVIAVVGVLLLFGKEKPMDCVVVKAEPAAIVVAEVVPESITPGLLAPSAPIRLLPPVFEIEAITVVDRAVDPVGSGINTAEFVPLSEAEFHCAISRMYCPNRATYSPLSIEPI